MLQVKVELMTLKSKEYHKKLKSHTGDFFNPSKVITFILKQKPKIKNLLEFIMLWELNLKKRISQANAHWHTLIPLTLNLQHK